MAGPAWVEPAGKEVLGSAAGRVAAACNATATAQTGPAASPAAEAEIASNSKAEEIHATAASASQQAQQAQQMDRYLRRLADATVEAGPADRHNPFFLEESSDDDDRAVKDRAAVKHRSYKITHPKQPKSPKAGGKGAAGSPVAPPPGR